MHYNSITPLLARVDLYFCLVKNYIFIIILCLINILNNNNHVASLHPSALTAI